jgi:hypothetical protein
MNSKTIQVILISLAVSVPVLPQYSFADSSVDGAEPGGETVKVANRRSQQAQIQELRQELDAQRRKTDELERKLEGLEQKQAQAQATPPPAPSPIPPLEAGRGKERIPGLAGGALQPADIYNNGFYVKTQDNSFSLFVNGLAQTRFTIFKPNAVSQFGAGNRYQNTFDLYLGRLAFSGNFMDPDTKYFFQFQASTAGNTNTVTMLDWFVSRTIAPYLTVQTGRSFIPYTYEYYDNPGNYLFPDLSTAEYAFLLQRAIGAQAYGEVGKLNYSVGVYNSIPALDVGGQQSINGKLAYVGHLQYDILAPYGYVETKPSPDPVTKPELTLWSSGMYNPVDYDSGFSNYRAGDRTYGATTSLLFRYNYLSAQATGYYRRTLQTEGRPSYNSWGYGEQAGYYLIPARVELAERISGVWWGEPEIPATGGNEVTWFSGPTNFSYHRITEYSVGLNFYLYGHNLKMQTAYSYLAGSAFTPTGSGFGANRLWIQTQLMF